jgi:hypothetical protein
MSMWMIVLCVLKDFCRIFQWPISELIVYLPIIPIVNRVCSFLNKHLAFDSWCIRNRYYMISLNGSLNVEMSTFIALSFSTMCDRVLVHTIFLSYSILVCHPDKNLYYFWTYILVKLNTISTNHYQNHLYHT